MGPLNPGSSSEAAELLTNTINFASQTSPTSTVHLACAGVLFKSPRARAMIQLGGREEK